jgi:hypothetical protein
MRTTQYLYGLRPDDFWHLPYGEALKVKLESGKALLGELEIRERNIDYESEEAYALRERIYYVQKAVFHNERLLREKENQ